MAFRGRYDHVYSTEQNHGGFGIIYHNSRSNRHTPYHVNVRQDQDVVSPTLCMIPIHQRTLSNPSAYQLREIRHNGAQEDHLFIKNRETVGLTASAQRFDDGFFQSDKVPTEYHQLHEGAHYDQNPGKARRDRFYQSDQSSTDHDYICLKRSFKNCKQGPNDTLLDYIRTLIEYYMELEKPLISHRFITRVLGGINSLYAPFCTIMDIDLVRNMYEFLERAKEIDEIVIRTKELPSSVNTCSIESFPYQLAIEHSNCHANYQLQTIGSNELVSQMTLGLDNTRDSFLHSDQPSNKKKRVRFRIDSYQQAHYKVNENNKEVIQELDNSNRLILCNEIHQPSKVHVDVASLTIMANNEVNSLVAEAAVANFQTTIASPPAKLVARKSGKTVATQSDSTAGLLSSVSPLHLWSLLERLKPLRQWYIRKIHSRLVYLQYENG